MRAGGITGAPGVVAFWAAVVASPVLPGVDFIRGDVNGDGQVTFSDAFALQDYIFELRGPFEIPPCPEALDVNDSGTGAEGNIVAIDIVDIARLIAYVLGYSCCGISDPFPSPGPDPKLGQVDTLPCDEYGGPPPIVDLQASLTVSAAEAKGGQDSMARVVIELSSSTSISAVFGELRFPPGILDAATDEVLGRRIDRLPGPGSGVGARVTDDVLRFEYMVANSDLDPILPGPSRPVLELFPCLRPGVPAGQYAISMASAELTDFDSTRAIHPAMTAASLLLEQAVGDAPLCSPPIEDPRIWGLPFPRAPFTRFGVGDALVLRGRLFDVPFFTESDGDIRAFSFSLDFDEDRIALQEIDETLELPADGFRFFAFDSSRRTPGNHGMDEGYISGAAVFAAGESPLGRLLAPNEVVRFHFEIVSDEPDFTTEISFLDGAPGPWGPIRNEVVLAARRFRPNPRSFGLRAGTIQVATQAPAFLRGDPNVDHRVDLSDAVSILSFLFAGTSEPGCLDAADVDDSGAIEITDAIFLLVGLFLGGESPPAPHPTCGLPRDSGERLGCSQRCSG